MFARASYPGSTGAPSFGWPNTSSSSSYGAPHSCSHQAHRSFGLRPSHAVYMDTDDDDVDNYGHYDYLRREAERRQLVEAQARRRATEEAYIARLREQEHEAVRARARARAEAEYRLRVEEQRRAARAQEQRRAIARAEEQREREIEFRRRAHAHAQATYENEFVRQLFGGLPAGFRHSPLSSEKLTQHGTPTVTVAVKAAPTVQHQQNHRRPAMSPEQAAHVIQVNLRRYVVVRRRLNSVAAIKAKFDSLRSSFVEPESYTFDSAKSTDAEPILAYSASNATYHAYVESLTRLLTDLDGIASEGSHAVKAERKQLAVAVEEELSRLEKAKLRAWEEQKRTSPAPAPAEAAAAVAVNENEQSTESQDVEIPAVEDEQSTGTNTTANITTHVHFAEHEDSPESLKATTVSDDEEADDTEVVATLVPAASVAPDQNDHPMSAVLEERDPANSEMQVDAHMEAETNEGYEVVAPTDAVESDRDGQKDLGTITSSETPAESTEQAPDGDEKAAHTTVDRDTPKDNPFDDVHRERDNLHHSDSGSDTEFEML